VSLRCEELEAEHPICAFAVRKEFDHFNFEKTIESGVEFQKISELSEIKEHRDRVQVVIDRQQLTSRFLIGADGANSEVRRLTNAGASFYRGFAIEGTVDYAELGHEPTAELFFGYVQNGYVWQFPKRDHVNVGIYTRDCNISLSKQQLRGYVRDRFGIDKLQNIVGFPIGFGGRRGIHDRERIILVGDAAGFAEPLLGEGIHNALKSGQRAASAICSFDSGNVESLRAAYKSALSPIYDDLACCEEIAQLFYPNLHSARFSALCFLIGKKTVRGLSAGKTVSEIIGPFQLLSLRLFARSYRIGRGLVARRF
jgi:flavin-dependent dehydrogenase